MSHPQTHLETEINLLETASPSRHLKVVTAAGFLSVQEKYAVEVRELQERIKREASMSLDQKAENWATGMKTALDKCALGQTSSFSGYFVVEDEFHALTHELFLAKLAPHVGEDAFAAFISEDLDQLHHKTSLVFDGVLLFRDAYRYSAGSQFYGYNYIAVNQNVDVQ